MRLLSIKYLIFNKEKEDLGPSLFNFNIHIRNQHVLKCRKNINFGWRPGGGLQLMDKGHWISYQHLQETNVY